MPPSFRLPQLRIGAEVGQAYELPELPDGNVHMRYPTAGTGSGISI